MSVYEQRGQVRQARDAAHSLFGTSGTAAPELPQLRTLPVTEPGFYAMTADEYHADPCPLPSLSSSLAFALVTSTPEKARLRHPRLNTRVAREDAEHFDIGHIAHAALLEGRSVVHVLNYDDYRTKVAQAAREYVRDAGCVPLLRKAWGELESMLEATRRRLDAHEDGVHMFCNGIPEVVLVWNEGPVWCRARLDWVRLEGRGYAIDDYKTTSTTADPQTVSDRQFFNHGLDVQAAFYRRGIYALTGRKAAFRFAMQECFSPYALSVLAPGPSAEILGEMRVDKALALWYRGIVDNEWPGYPVRTAHVEVPAWLEKKEADREVSDAV